LSTPQGESPDGQLRDQLAVQRTQLANERTLLAYARTSLMLASSGAATLKVFAASPGAWEGGWALIVLGAGVFAWGVRRFLSMRRQL
jgi:putative membrane protein